MDECVTPQDDQVERWLPVVGYEGLYDISSLGRVCSFHGRERGNGKRGGLLRPGLSNKHWSVVLYRDGCKDSFPVHQLVARAFLGLPEEGQMVRHGRGGMLDNRLVNLSYGTSKENADDMVRDGVRVWGESIHNSVLTAEIWKHVS